jgi:hypothetical protein
MTTWPNEDTYREQLAEQLDDEADEWQRLDAEERRATTAAEERQKGEPS